MDPLTTKDGKPFGPVRYKQLNKECYFIVKSSSYSYESVLEMTPVQRQFLREFIKEEFDNNKKSMEEISKNKQQKVRHR